MPGCGDGAMKMELRFEGGDKLRRALAELPEATERRIALNALKKGAEPMRIRADELAPRKTGELARHMVTNTVRKQDAQEHTVAVGPAVSAFYGLFQELADEYGGVRNPARPFLRPAFDEMAPAAISIVRDEMWKSIKRRAKRLGAHA